MAEDHFRERALLLVTQPLELFGVNGEVFLELLEVTLEGIYGAALLLALLNKFIQEGAPFVDRLLQEELTVAAEGGEDTMGEGIVKQIVEEAGLHEGLLGKSLKALLDLLHNF